MNIKNDSIRKQFPTIEKYTYFDSAALVLKPQRSIDAIRHYYEDISISPRTKDTSLGFEVTKKISETRKLVASLIEAQEDEVIFTSGTTESLNLIAHMLEPLLKKSDNIVLDQYNHSSNMATWLVIGEKLGIDVIITDDVIKKINKNTKVVSLAQATNTFTKEYDWELLYKKTRKFGSILINDAAQAIIHDHVSLKNCDVIAFSSNKMYGPTGLGVLAIRQELISKLTPYKLGGGTIVKIDSDNHVATRKDIEAFEAGTPNIAGLYMFNESIKFFNEIGIFNSRKILKELSEYAHSQLKSVKNIEIYSNPGDFIIMFNIKNFFCEDMSYFLSQSNIYTRSGWFCAHYLANVKQPNGFVRMSLGIYNNFGDIDKLVKTLKSTDNYLVI